MTYPSWPLQPNLRWGEVAVILDHMSCLREARQTQEQLTAELYAEYSRTKTLEHQNRHAMAAALCTHLEFNRNAWRDQLRAAFNAALETP